ncbi:hypothetical protein CDAR_433491 [Caerostris darwini]|uniref:Uncharacterized protein n=1 Tax=Caerostris darwini TaxID=1538125 RepID=A0AAV4WCB6_9ARAC|nr:hypothetical protein CDAR_433491 [Caerostris darwini]
MEREQKHRVLSNFKCRQEQGRMMERLPGIKDAAERMGDICEKICLQGRCVMEEQRLQKQQYGRHKSILLVQKVECKRFTPVLYRCGTTPNPLIYFNITRTLTQGLKARSFRRGNSTYLQDIRERRWALQPLNGGGKILFVNSYYGMGSQPPIHVITVHRLI